MTRYFALSLIMVTERFHGVGDNHLREWPPSPHRVFQALVAGAHIGRRHLEWSQAKVAALKWLEQRCAPQIIASSAVKEQPYAVSVPNNDFDRVGRAWAGHREPSINERPAKLRTMKTFNPVRLTESSPVTFLWQIENEEWPEAGQHTDILCQMAKHLHCLGLGIDLCVAQGSVIGEEACAELAGRRWSPRPAQSGWRVPRNGCLEDLQRRHTGCENRFQQINLVSSKTKSRNVTVLRRAPRLRAYNCAQYSTESVSSGRSYHLFALRDGRSDWSAFPATWAVRVAGMLRHTAINAAVECNYGTAELKSVVAGHGNTASEKSDRLAYLPLPSIGHSKADGRIRRALLIEPVSNGADWSYLARRMVGEPLIDEGTGEIWAELHNSNKDNVFDQYLCWSQRWASVTPVLLPGFDDGKIKKAYRLIKKSIAQAGLPSSINDLVIGATPIFPKTYSASAYPSSAKTRRWPRLHAIITFAEPVPGPIAIGGGRHSGLGVFAALD